MRRQKKLIEKGSWDVLIILDACRYDYFKKTYEDFLSGHLEKVISSGTTTIDWLKSTFQKRYDDITYISANPFINSRRSIQGFNATEHFQKIIDVWDWGWDEEWSWVHPKKVNKAVKRAKMSYPNTRFIIHYLQPHAPYTFLMDRVKSKVDPLVCLFQRIQILILTLVRSPKWVGRWILRYFLRGNPINAREWTALKFGKDGIRLAYKQNLKLVLKYVKLLIGEDLSGKVVVTSDHGELLGENREYGHDVPYLHPKLQKVPWFVVGTEENTQP